MLAPAKIRQRVLRDTDELYSIVGLPKTAYQYLEMMLNSYTFALGDIDINIYSGCDVGYTRNILLMKYTEDQLLEAICMDLTSLGKKYEVLKSFQPSKRPRKNEFMLKVYYAEPSTCGSRRGDFHVIRYDRKLGCWFHKPAQGLPPEILRRKRNGTYDDGEPMFIYKKTESGRDYACHGIYYIAVRDKTFFEKLSERFFGKR